MDRKHADKTMQERKALRVESYADSVDHRFTPAEQKDYDSLSANGRSFYDDARWYEGTAHDIAFADAKHSYGLKKVI